MTTQRRLKCSSPAVFDLGLACRGHLLHEMLHGTTWHNGDDKRLLAANHLNMIHVVQACVG